MALYSRSTLKSKSLLAKAKLLAPPVPKMELTPDELAGTDETKEVVVTGAAERTVREELLGKLESEELLLGKLEKEEVLGKLETEDEVRVREEDGGRETGRKEDTGVEETTGRKDETGVEETAVRRGVVAEREASLPPLKEERRVRVAGAEATVLEDPIALLLGDPEPKEVETVFLMNGVSWEMMLPTRSESLLPDETACETTCSTGGRPRI